MAISDNTRIPGFHEMATNMDQAAMGALGQSEAETIEIVTWVREQLDAARPIAGTPGERYLIDHCGLRPPFPSSLLWADRYQSSPDVPPRPCLIATITDPIGEIVGVRWTEIDPRTGERTQATDNPPLIWGPRCDGAVFLRNTEDLPPTLVLGEDIETVLTRCLLGPCDARSLPTLTPERWPGA